MSYHYSQHNLMKDQNLFIAAKCGDINLRVGMISLFCEILICQNHISDFGKPKSVVMIMKIISVFYQRKLKSSKSYQNFNFISKIIRHINFENQNHVIIIVSKFQNVCHYQNHDFDKIKMICQKMSKSYQPWLISCGTC